MFLETFVAFFREFNFLTQTEYFALAVAFALWPFLAIFEMLSLFRILAVFWSPFLLRTTLVLLYIGFLHVFVNFNFGAKLASFQSL